MFRMKFTDIGEGLHEGTVAEVFVKVGDSVKEGDNLFTVETDKMTSEIPAPTTGVIAEVLIEPGQEIHVGEEIFVIEEK
ncbi:biotin/lipoyl-binding protein [Mycoplasmopsis phocirhinis]|uniref:Biotin/lipoyl-binding protein n=1 Tax=Mycoplasmopsis phocirhinis TaxID=142650 RepID=A0A4P6MP73_9BACT|nr:biotin/lipoyl-containing protein [Mycoplasmopsis phocirhinis]QBF34680.1 biotin/lipoyl-binding protein [Mycoplasmopsis phocirhinis]